MASPLGTLAGECSNVAALAALKLTSMHSFGIRDINCARLEWQVIRNIRLLH